MLIRRGATRSTLAVAATALVLLLAATNITRQAVSGVMDDGVLWGDEHGRVVALRVAEGGAGDAAGIEPGDALQAITDRESGEVVEVDRAADVRGVLDAASPGARLRYVLVREGERRGMTLSVVPLPGGNVSLYLFLAAVGIFSGGVGTFVYAFRRGASAAAHFYGLCLLWLLAFSFSFTGELDLFDHLYFWLDRIGVLFFPPVFLHFALTFPNASRFLARWPKLPRWVYAPSFALLALSLGSRLLYFSPLSPGPATITGSEIVLDRLEPVLWAIYSLAAFAAFVDAYRNAESVTVSKQLKWIVWGTGAGMLPFALIYAVPYFGGLPTTPATELSLVPMALVPLSFAYAIVKYRLMDVEILFKRGILVASLMAGIAAIYLAAFLLGTSWFGGDEHSLVIAVLSAIVAALVVPAFRKRTERFLDRLFYRENYDFRRALARLAGEMNSQLDLTALANRLVDRIAETFRMERVALLTAHRPPGGAELKIVAAHGLDDREGAVAERFTASASVRKRLGTGAVARTALMPAPVRDGVWVVNAVPCFARGEVVGVFLLGATVDGEDLSSEDLDLLRTVAAQAATALVNARLYSSLQAKHEEVVALREQSDDTIESLAAGIVVLDLRGRVIRWNRSMERLYGRSRHEVAHSSFTAVFPPRLLRALDAGLGENWLARGRGRRDFPAQPARAADGAERVVNVKAAPFISGSGQHHGAPPHLRRHHRAGRDGKRDATAGKDEFARGPRRRSRPRSQHSADRDLQLHPDAAGPDGPRRPPPSAPHQDRKTDRTRLADRERPAQLRPSQTDRLPARGPQPGARGCVLPARPSDAEFAHPDPKGDGPGAAAAPRRREQAAAGLREPCGERLRRHAGGRLAHDHHPERGRPDHRRGGGHR